MPPAPAQGVSRPQGGVRPLPVSAVIVSYNRRDDLRRCLRSLTELAPAIAEIIVIDNGSTDGTPAMVAAEFPQVALHMARSNLGPCIARNAGAVTTTQDYLWFLDSDTEATGPDAARQLVDVLENDRGLAGIGGEAVLGSHGEVVGVKPLRLMRNAMVRGDVVTTPGVVPCGVIASCNMMVRRANFERLGGFDPFYFFFFEDIDLGYRLSRTSGRLVGLAPMPIIHHYSESTRIRRAWLEGRNRLYFVIKNLPLRTVLLLPLLDAATLLSGETFDRLRKRSARGDEARAQVQADALPATPAAGPAGAGGRLRRAVKFGFDRLAMLAFGYVAILPHLPAAIAARRRPANHLADRQALRGLIGVQPAMAPAPPTRPGPAG